jgi:acyl-CoA thioesterase I
MKKFLIAILLTLFTLPVLAENTILIIGDSLSAGYGIDPKQGWAQLLQERLQDRKYNYQVVNASITGDTTSNGLRRLPAALTQYQPKITIIELGGNDALRGLPTPLIKKNIQQMITLAENANSKVVLLGVRIPPNYGEAYTTQFQQIYQDFGQQDDLVVIPLFLNGIDSNPTLMQGDGIHPLATAQATMLENVWSKLQKLLQY